MKNFTVWIPVTINIDEITAQHPTTLKRDKLLYIIHLIRSIRTEDRRNVVNGEWILINAEALKSVISNYKEYLTYLEKVGLIECDGKAKKGVRSNGFKFTNVKYILVQSKKVILKDRTLLTALEKAWKKDNYGTEYVRRHLPYLYRPFFNGKLTIIVPSGLVVGSSSNSAINAIQSQNIRLSVDKFGKRLHTPLTRINKNLRQYLRYDNEELIEIDIKCSQPYLSIKYMLDDLSKSNQQLIEQINSNQSTEEKLEHIKLLENCDGFYEYLNDILIDDLYLKLKEDWSLIYDYPIGKGKREDYKVVVFETLYSHNRSTSKAKDIFIKKYPYPYKILHQIKGGNHKDLSKKLQRLESSIMLRKVCKTISLIDNNIPLFTIHDSILTTQKHVDVVKQVMSNILLDEIGFHPILKNQNSKNEI